MKVVAAIRPVARWPLWAKIAILAGAILLSLIVLASVPVPVRPYLDFQVLYHADLGLLRGVQLYDHAGQVNMIAQLANVAPERVYVLPFPYPPWYALSTIWLAWLPIEMAAHVWFAVSMILLLVSAWLLTDGWKPLSRILALLLAMFFLPVLGSLLVGQYGFPVLLGAALMVYALRHENPLLTALAAALLTYKPHLGGLILLAALLYLWQRKDAFGRRAVLYSVVAGAVLFFVGFFADHAWPVDYVRSLLAFQTDSGVASCDLCASLPVLIANRLSTHAGFGLSLATGILILLLLALIWLVAHRAALRDPQVLIAASILSVLLASPYLLNYDFMLLLVPLAFLAAKKRGLIERVLIVIVFILPFIALGIWGRQGNFIFPLCAILLLVMLYLDKQLLDGSLPAA